jgi:hypothetical protein
VGIIYAAARPKLFRALEVEESLGVAVVADLPWVRKKENIGEDPAFTKEALKLCVFITAAQGKEHQKSVLVTTPEAGSGVSTVTRVIAGLLRSSVGSVDVVDVMSSPLVEALDAGTGEESHSEGTADLPAPELPAPGSGSSSVAAGRERSGITAQRTSTALAAEEPARPSTNGAKESPGLTDGAPLSQEIVLFDGGSLRSSPATVALAQTVDVIVLVVALPSPAERDMNAFLRTVLDQSSAKIIVVAKHR